MIKLDFSRRFLQIFFSIFTVILVIFTILVVIRGREDYIPNDCKKLAIEGSYSLDGGSTFADLDEYTVISPTRSGHMVIKGHLTSGVGYMNTIYVFVQGLKVKIYINDKLVLDHQEVTQETWIGFRTTGITADDDVYIELVSNEDYLYNVGFGKFINRIYDAEKYELVIELMNRNGIHLIACLIIVVMGVCILIYRECFKGIKTYNPVGLRSCGMMMIMGGLTCYLDYNYITLVSRNLYFLRFLDFISQAMLVIFVSAYLKRYMFSERSKERADTIVLTMVIFLSIYMVRYIVTDHVQEFDWLFLTFVVVVAGMLVIELRDVYYEGMMGPPKNRMAFDSVLLLVIGFISEMVYFVLTGTYRVKIMEVCMLIFAVMQYYLLVSTNVDNYYKAQQAQELENELVQNQIKLMLGQIQPHFLYNAIGTIRALCVKKPDEARNALDYFAKYLRANMDSLSEAGCIPFSKELDHVKSYLYIEKLRFGDLLEVKYEIGTMDFECPPLMLQTMVENAVKHGLLPNKDCGTIRISTKEVRGGVEICIEDNGVGFDTNKPLEEGRSHIGVDNTRQRVMALCHGSLNIGSRVGVGTTITIIIPKKSTVNGGGNESNIG